MDNTIRSSAPISKNTLYNKTEATNFMKSLDTNFESFFHKRELTTKNLNYYIEVLSTQGKQNECEQVLAKISEIGLKPNEETCHQIWRGFALDKNIAKCEEYFNLIKTEINSQPNKFIYNTLLLAYAKNGKTNECLSILRDEG